MMLENELIDLLGVSLADEKIIKLITDLGKEVPVIDEKYYTDGYVVVFAGKFNLSLTFSADKEDIQSGLPTLSKFDFVKSGSYLSMPGGITFDDNYESCCTKLNSFATYTHKFSKELRAWVFETPQKEEYNISVNFIDNELSGIRSVVVAFFDSSKIGKIYLDLKNNSN